MLQGIERAFQGLTEHPQRGNHPRQPVEIGIRQSREVVFKPFRIIYRVVGDKVYVLVIAVGRRGMLTLLQRRLLQAYASITTLQLEVSQTCPNQVWS